MAEEKQQGFGGSGGKSGNVVVGVATVVVAATVVLEVELDFAVVAAVVVLAVEVALVVVATVVVVVVWAVIGQNS